MTENNYSINILYKSGVKNAKIPTGNIILNNILHKCLYGMLLINIVSNIKNILNTKNQPC